MKKKPLHRISSLLAATVLVLLCKKIEKTLILK